jgi:site-specific DNA-methyltransferase (adenine-specific)
MKNNILQTNNIYYGDCLEIMPLIPDKSIDMILCDLLYGTTACKWDVVIPFEPLWKDYKRIIKDRGCIALFGNQPFTSALIMSNIKQFKYFYTWVKNNPTGFLNAKKQPLRITEDISIFYNNQCFYNPQKVTRQYVTRRTKNIQSDNYGNQNHIDSGRFITEGYPYNILFFDRVASDYIIHPTQKPVALLEYLIKTYTLENETVLDNCMGSGSTCIACINTNRNFIGIENELKYFEIAKNRIEKAKKEKEYNLF